MKLALIKPQEKKHFVRLIESKLDYKKQPYVASIDVKMAADAVKKQREIDKFLGNVSSKITQLEKCRKGKALDVDKVYDLLEVDEIKEESSS